MLTLGALSMASSTRLNRLVFSKLKGVRIVLALDLHGSLEVNITHSESTNGATFFNDRVENTSTFIYSTSLENLTMEKHVPSSPTTPPITNIAREIVL